MTSTVEMVLDAARRRRDEIEVAMYFDNPEPWERDQLRDELSEQLSIIEDCEVMLGLKSYLNGWRGNHIGIWRRLRRWARKQVRRWR